MEQVIDILKSTRELLADEKSWTQGALARDEEGTPVWIMDEEVVQWCLTGAIDRVCHFRIMKNEEYFNAKLLAVAAIHKLWYGEDYYEMVEEMKKDYKNIRFVYTNLMQFNDDTSTVHTTIINAIDESIDIVKGMYESNE